LQKEIVNMKYLLSMVLVALLAFLPMMAAVADEAVNADQESAEAAGHDDAWDEPVDIVYEEDGTKETGEEAREEAGEEEETNPFVGEWLCEKASIYIDEQDGTFDVFIMWDVSDTEEDIWEYSCKLDAETGVLTGEGKKSHEVIDGEGEVVSSEEVYTDGTATFALEDGALIWDDAKEAVAQGMRFERGEEDELLEEYDEIDETVDAEDQETEDEASAN
jgi:hypothetical protein